MTKASGVQDHRGGQENDQTESESKLPQAFPRAKADREQRAPRESKREEVESKLTNLLLFREK